MSCSAARSLQIRTEVVHLDGADLQITNATQLGHKTLGTTELCSVQNVTVTPSLLQSLED